MAPSCTAPTPADQVILADHSHVTIRPIAPCDRDALASGFARLSEDSRYRRFLSPKTKLTQRELTYLTEVDHVRHEALVAVDPGDGHLVGVGRYASGGSQDSAELAVVVDDEHQALGLGTALATRTVARARSNGIGALTATSLRLNRASLAIMRRLGFRARGSDGATVELELPLSQPSRRRRSSSGAWPTARSPRSAERTARKSRVAATS
jgi:RimJ/RimL family protein N-acetyltransferase